MGNHVMLTIKNLYKKNKMNKNPYYYKLMLK